MYEGIFDDNLRRLLPDFIPINLELEETYDGVLDQERHAKNILKKVLNFIRVQFDVFSFSSTLPLVEFEVLLAVVLESSD